MISVLLVDDNGPIRKSLRSLLEQADDMQVVATATNGVSAVEKARSLRPEVAVMDISRPIMDGIEATDHIRECCRLTRVIIFSGLDAKIRESRLFFRIMPKRELRVSVPPHSGCCYMGRLWAQEQSPFTACALSDMRGNGAQNLVLPQREEIRFLPFVIAL